VSSFLALDLYLGVEMIFHTELSCSYSSPSLNYTHKSVFTVSKSFDYLSLGGLHYQINWAKVKLSIVVSRLHGPEMETYTK